MTVLVSTQQIAALKAASSPEEAAQVFLALVSRGLASVIASTLDETLTAATAGTIGVAAIDGWNKLVKGGVVDLTWERPSIGSPVGQIVSHAARKTDGLQALGIDVSIGIGISARF